MNPTIKNLIIAVFSILLLASCGKVLTPDELLNPNKDLAKQSDLDGTNSRVDAIERLLVQYYDTLSQLSNQIDNLDIDQDILEQTIAMNSASIISLQDNTTIKEIIDPCGPNSGQYDEVLLVMSDDSIVAYFEQGSKRFLTIIKDGNYRTTDSQACNFSIVNGEYVE